MQPGPKRTRFGQFSITPEYNVVGPPREADYGPPMIMLSRSLRSPWAAVATSGVGEAQSPTTRFSADALPLRPGTKSNSTVWPSRKLLSPACSTAEM